MGGRIVGSPDAGERENRMSWSWNASSVRRLLAGRVLEKHRGNQSKLRANLALADVIL